MNDISLSLLFTILGFLIVGSAFFSASETAMISLNRYRLKTLADQGLRSAKMAQKMLDDPARMLGTILLGNNLLNMAAASVSTIIALRLYGDSAIAAATFILTVVILIFAEVSPKTFAALKPEKIAFPAVYVLFIFQKIAYPIVFVINLIGNFLITMINGGKLDKNDKFNLSELRTIVMESGILIPSSHRDMLLRIIDLDDITVSDIMVPRTSIEAIDIEDDWDELINELTTSHHSRIPIYQGSINNMLGFVSARKALQLMSSKDFDLDTLKSLIIEPYYMPINAKLNRQLAQMQINRQRAALVVDEYGDIMGLVTIEEILEQIIGDYTDIIPGIDSQLHAEDDGSYILSGNVSIREINRKLHWDLPTHGPKTLNGLIIEKTEDIPAQGVCLEIKDYQIEVLKTANKNIEAVKIQKMI